MKVRFLADANFNQKIAAGLLLREPSIDFALAADDDPRKNEGPGCSRPCTSVGPYPRLSRWFDQCVEERSCAGLILVPERALIRDVIEDLLLIWHVTEAKEWVSRMEWLPL